MLEALNTTRTLTVTTFSEGTASGGNYKWFCVERTHEYVNAYLVFFQLKYNFNKFCKLISRDYEIFDYI